MDSKLDTTQKARRIWCSHITGKNVDKKALATLWELYHLAEPKLTLSNLSSLINVTSSNCRKTGSGYVIRLGKITVRVHPDSKAHKEIIWLLSKLPKATNLFEWILGKPVTEQSAIQYKRSLGVVKATVEENGNEDEEVDDDETRVKVARILNRVEKATVVADLPFQQGDNVFLQLGENKWYGAKVMILAPNTTTLQLNSGKVERMPTKNVQSLVVPSNTQYTRNAPLTTDQVAEWNKWSPKEHDMSKYAVGNRVIVQYDEHDADSCYSGTVTDVDKLTLNYTVLLDDNKTKITLRYDSRQILGIIRVPNKQELPIPRSDVPRWLGKRVAQVRKVSNPWEVGHRIVVDYEDEGIYIGTVTQVSTKLTIQFDNGQVDKVSPHDPAILGFGTLKIANDEIPSAIISEYLLPPNKPPVKYRPPAEYVEEPSAKEQISKQRQRDKLRTRSSGGLAVNKNPQLVALGLGKTIKTDNDSYVIGRIERINVMGTLANLYLVRVSELDRLKPSVLVYQLKDYAELSALDLTDTESELLTKVEKLIATTPRRDVVPLNRKQTAWD